LISVLVGSVILGVVALALFWRYRVTRRAGFFAASLIVGLFAVGVIAAEIKDEYIKPLFYGDPDLWGFTAALAVILLIVGLALFLSRGRK
jgi:peptidoglycan/LPS O-acetylase OafA/YrhL